MGVPINYLLLIVNCEQEVGVQKNSYQLSVTSYQLSVTSEKKIGVKTVRINKKLGSKKDT